MFRMQTLFRSLCKLTTPTVSRSVTNTLSFFFCFCMPSPVYDNDVMTQLYVQNKYGQLIKTDVCRLFFSSVLHRSNEDRSARCAIAVCCCAIAVSQLSVSQSFKNSWIGQFINSRSGFAVTQSSTRSHRIQSLLIFVCVQFGGPVPDHPPTFSDLVLTNHSASWVKWGGNSLPVHNTFHKKNALQSVVQSNN